MAQTHARHLKHLLERVGLSETTDNKERKQRMTQHNLMWFLNKTAQMFEYTNLPPTIPHIALERLIQICGSACIWAVPTSYTPVGFGPSFNISDLSPTRVGPDDGSTTTLYAFPYTLADAPDPYDEPYKVVITSPGFRPSISETLELNKDCVIIRNDTNYQGLYQLHLKYARLMTEAEISLLSTLILLRDQMTFIVKNERQRAAVAAYIEAREAGDFASILAPELGSALEAINHDGRSNAVELAVNGIQAIKAAWYNEIGLNPSFSLKREYTSAQEIDSNTDLLMPIIDDMFNQRKVGIDNINALFGTNITVKKSSAWAVKDTEIEMALKAEEMETQGPTQVGEEGGDGDDIRGNESDSSGGSDTGE